MKATYEKEITENLGNDRNLILLGVRADADIKHLNKENRLLRQIMSEGSHTIKGQELIKELNA